MNKDKFLQDAFNELLRVGFEFIEPNEYKLTREESGAVYMINGMQYESPKVQQVYSLTHLGTGQCISEDGRIDEFEEFLLKYEKRVAVSIVIGIYNDLDEFKQVIRNYFSIPV